MNRSSIAKSASDKKGLKSTLIGFASGLIAVGDYIPESTSEYWQYRRYMHDILCDGLVDAGHYSSGPLHLSDLGIKTDNRSLNDQNPDLYTLDGLQLAICEVTLSFRPELSKQKKNTKYIEFLETIKNYGYNVVYNVLIVDLTDAEWEMKVPTISDLHLDMLRDFIENLRHIHSDPKFLEIRKEETGSYMVDTFGFTLEDSCLEEEVFKATGVNMAAKEIKARLTIGSKEGLSDKVYINKIAASILDGRWVERPIPHPDAHSALALEEEWEAFKAQPETTNKLPKILQLGCPFVLHEEDHNLPFEDLVSEIRERQDHGGYLSLLKSSLEREDPTDRLVTLGLTQDQLEREQREGPGRKAFLKARGLKVEREAPKHIAIKPDHESKLNEMITRVTSEMPDFRLLETQQINADQMGFAASHITSKLLDRFESCSVSAVLKFYQRISTEIILNSMRRRKARQYSLARSGFKGVFFLVAPGPQLRTESNVIFIKIISFHPGLDTLSALWEPIGRHWESKWLSVDTDRLKHWQRAYDRVSLSMLSMVEKLVTPERDMNSCLASEIKLGNYALMALTYLEDKNLTSVTNQTIRYLWMKSLGDRQMSGLISKFPDRVNSVIQSVMMSRAVTTALEVCRQPLTNFLRSGTVKRDDETGAYDETTTSAIGLLPRLFTAGPAVPVHYNLNEIYWCMAYNKDRQNQAQDAMNIMKKIVKEERNYDLEIGKRVSDTDKVSYFLGNTTVREDIEHIHSQKPESHYFSYRAVLAGMRLQDVHDENMGDRGSWKTHEEMSRILGKNLSEFATFKASVKQIADQINPKDLADIDKIGKRTKAIELVAELVQNEKLMKSADVAMQYSGDNNKAFEVLIQIFKKGQIGGVREIIILFIKARIIFNIVEEVARVLSKSDKREILTKGKDKRLMMRGDYEEVMSHFPAGTAVKVVRDSFDMTTWAQKFIPTIFIAMYQTHFSDYRPMLDLARFIFLKHSNKRIEYPKKLVDQWIKHPELKHKEPGMQDIKENFLSNGKPWFLNHSNMCQGIPHYNSTVLALSCLSLRDALFKECLKILNQPQLIHWKSRVGSDDKGTILGINLSDERAYKQYLLFGQCEHAAERLHSMELSVKSASGNMIYELNSAFMVNLETLSPTIKFTMASCDMIGTTSCSQYVNESFSRIRQLRENGGSSILCSYAHMLNKANFNLMFSVGPGDINDPRELFNLDEVDVPFDFGVYPTYDADLQDIVGPEYHNYRVYKREKYTRKGNPALALLFKEVGSEASKDLFKSEEAGLLKKDHFGIHQGMVRQLTAMRRRVNASAEEVEKFFEENPFQMIRGPETLEETRMAILSKLFTTGASESLRRTSPAIYAGRLSAFRTARAWTVYSSQGEEGFDFETGDFIHFLTEIKVTYREFIAESLKRVDPVLDCAKIASLKDIIYPQWRSFDVVEQFVGKFGALKTSSKKFSQAVRTWTANNFNYEFSSSLKSILETSFGLSQLSSKEDVGEFKKLINLDLKSLDRFILDCKKKSLRPLDVFFYMSKIYRSTKTSKVQTFAYGPSTGSLHLTALSIKRYNHMPGSEMLLQGASDEFELSSANTSIRSMDEVKICTNLLMMNLLGYLRGPKNICDNVFIRGVPLSSLVTTFIRGTKSISGMDNVSKKMMKFVASQMLPTDEFKEKMTSWKTLNYSYIKKQRRVLQQNGKVSWTGDLVVLVNSGPDCFTLNERSGSKFLRTQRILDLESLLLALKEICHTMGFDYRSFFVTREVKPGEIYLSSSLKMLCKADFPGAIVPVLKLRLDENFKHKRLQDFSSFSIKTTVNKASAIETFMTDGQGRSASLSHFAGSYYPVTIPWECTVNPEFWFQGVRLNRIFENKDWFYNHRLPSMSTSESLKFLKEDVDIVKVLTLKESDLARIQDYIEVRREVTEDNFVVSRELTQDTSVNPIVPLEVLNDTTKLMDLFRQEIDQGLDNSSFNDFLPNDLARGIPDWAEEMEGQFEEEDIFKGMNEADGINFVRSFGYRPPKAKKNQAVISSLQQGSFLRSRVLDLFFKDSNISFEPIRTLPNYYIWLNHLQGNDSLRDALMTVIVDYLVTTQGLDGELIRMKLDSKSTDDGVPMQMVKSYLKGSDKTPQDIFTELLEDTYGQEEGSDPGC